MNRHELPEEDGGEGGDAETVRAVEVKLNTAKTVEIKVAVAAAVVLFANIVYAVLSAVGQDPHILNALPEWARFVILAAIPPVLGFLAGYAVPSNRV